MTVYPNNEAELLLSIKNFIKVDSFSDSEIIDSVHSYLNSAFLKDTAGAISPIVSTQIITTANNGTNLFFLDRLLYLRQNVYLMFKDSNGVIHEDLLFIPDLELLFVLKKAYKSTKPIVKLDDLISQNIYISESGDSILFENQFELTEDISVDILAHQPPTKINGILDSIFRRKTLLPLIIFGTCINIATKKSMTLETNLQKQYDDEINNLAASKFAIHREIMRST